MACDRVPGYTHNSPLDTLFITSVCSVCCVLHALLWLPMSPMCAPQSRLGVSSCARSIKHIIWWGCRKYWLGRVASLIETPLWLMGCFLGTLGPCLSVGRKHRASLRWWQAFWLWLLLCRQSVRATTAFSANLVKLSVSHFKLCLFIAPCLS